MLNSGPNTEYLVFFVAVFLYLLYNNRQMRSIQFLLFISLLSTGAYSQIVNNLVLICNEPEPFTLIMNGERYNDEPSTKVKAVNLNLPKYAYKIIFKNPEIKPIEAVFTFYGSGNECTFSVNKKSKKKYQVVYLTEKRMEGFEDIPKNNTPVNTNTYVPPTNTQTNSTPTNTYNTGPGQTNQNTNQNTIKFGPVGVNLSKGTIGMNGKVGGVDVNVEEPIKKNKPAEVKDSTFTILKKNIEKQESEEKKLSEAKASLDKNTYTTKQIREVMDLLKGDEAKLDYAKSAYKSCKDQKKYKDLCEGLSSDASKKDLKKFIEKQSD